MADPKRSRKNKTDRRAEERRARERRSAERRHLYCRRSVQFSFDEPAFAFDMERRQGERRQGCRRSTERRVTDRRSTERRTGERKSRIDKDAQSFLSKQERDFLASLTSSDS